jgi:hypothetical protein
MCPACVGAASRLDIDDFASIDDNITIALNFEPLSGRRDQGMAIADDQIVHHGRYSHHPEMVLFERTSN